jgi:hypothetical protein
MHELDQPLCKFAGKLMKLNNLINIGARNVTLKYDLIFPMPCTFSGKLRVLGPKRAGGVTNDECIG